MEQWILSWMNEYGYFGIFFLIAMENLFPPIPSEVILTFGGFMTAHTGLSTAGVVLASTLGSVTGALLLYGIGTWLDEKRLERLVARWGPVLRLQMDDIRRAFHWFDKYGAWAVFLCRLVPLVRSLISVPAGMARMSFVTFLLLTTIGSLIWNTVLVRIGSAVGESWHSIVQFMDVFSNIVYALLAIGFLLAVTIFIRKRFFQK